MLHPERQCGGWGKKEVMEAGLEMSQVGSRRLAPEPQAPSHSTL